MKHLKIRKIGNSLGVVLPKDILEQLDAGEGDSLALIRTEKGFELVQDNSKFARTMEVAERGMKKYRNTLRELAK